MPTQVDDRRAALITTLGLSAAAGAALSITDLEELYDSNQQASGSTPVLDGAWTNMVLDNGFTAGSITPQYMKDSRGRVFLRGRVVSPAGLVGVVSAWTIPVGFRTVSNFSYTDWVAGGSPAGTEGDPKTLIVVAATEIRVNYDGTGAADLVAGKVTDLRRGSWPTT